MEPIKADPKEKKVRNARSYDSIIGGALKLPLGERANLLKSLKASIDAEVSVKQKEAEEAKAIANGTHS